MGLFVDSDGNSIKFFIQRDFNDELKNELREKIQAEGGRVEDKIPIKGYMLGDLGTSEADRLKSLWTNKADRPERFLVPFKWVDACRTAGRLLIQLFREDNDAINIHIHESIANPVYRQDLHDRIVFSGGNPDGGIDDSVIILADPQTEVYKTLEKTYARDPERYVFSYEFIQQCIDRGYFHLDDKPPYKNPGGRRPGEERTAFTAEDEANLCMWISTVIPCKESGGRTGNKIYQELVARHTLAGFEWVKRHPWQSWRERYKKNAPRLDQQIQAIVDSKRSSAPPDKSQFGIFRIQEHKPNKPSRKRKRPNGQETVNTDALSVVPGTTDSVPPTVMSQTGEEWAIREGFNPAPAWAKRPIIEEQMVAGSSKSGNPETSLVSDIEWQIEAISTKYHFFKVEVREYYEKWKDLSKTAQHFQDMRTFVNSMS